MKPFFPESRKPGDRKVYRVRYTAASAGSDGRPTRSSSETEITDRANVKPVTEETIQRLSEGRREDVELEISSDAEIRASDPEHDHPADEIKIVNNDRNETNIFEVSTVEQRGTFLPHYEATLVRLQEG